MILLPLLWPIEKSKRWNIEPDEKLLSSKREYLNRLGELEPGETPNIILIVADDLGKYDVSLYNHAPMATPNIDELGEMGITFNSAFATAPICSPSRAGLLTGRYQNRFGFESQPMQRYVRNYLEYIGFRFLISTDEMQPLLYPSYPPKDQQLKQGLPLSEITLAEVFDAVGYNTAIIGKWHLGYSDENHPLRFGFNFQYGFMEAFSLYDDEDDPGIVNYHHDLFWEEHIWDQQRSGPSSITRDGKEIVETRYLTDAIVEETKHFISESMERGEPFFTYLPFNAPHTPFQARKSDYEALDHIADDNQRTYLAMISRLDWAVGELSRFLQAKGIAEDTLIIFTSDNGGAHYTGATDNGPLRAGKFTQFDGGLAVPLMMYWPGRLERKVMQENVLLTDLFSTLTHLLGVPLPEDREYDSVNLLAESLYKVAGDRPLQWRSDYNRAVRFDRFKLMQNLRDGTTHLYDVKSDMGEENNLAESHQREIEKLESYADAWERDMKEPLWPRVMDYLLESNGEYFWFAI